MDGKKQTERGWETVKNIVLFGSAALGYETAYTGKWHLAGNQERSYRTEAVPAEHLVKDPRYEAVRAELRAQIIAFMKQAHEPPARILQAP